MTYSDSALSSRHTFCSRISATSPDPLSTEVLVKAEPFSVSPHLNVWAQIWTLIVFQWLFQYSCCCCCCCYIASVVSDSVWPQRWQPTRLPCLWYSPGKNTGVGCHFLLQCMKVKSESEVAQSCPTPRDPMDCSPPGSSVHGFSRQEYWSGVPLQIISNDSVIKVLLVFLEPQLSFETHILWLDNFFSKVLHGQRRVRTWDKVLNTLMVCGRSSIKKDTVLLKEKWHDKWKWPVTTHRITCNSIYMKRPEEANSQRENEICAGGAIFLFRFFHKVFGKSKQMFWPTQSVVVTNAQLCEHTKSHCVPRGKSEVYGVWIILQKSC